MAEIIWTAHALNDLNGIAEYIALSNLAATKNLMLKVFEKITRLENHPESEKIPFTELNMTNK